MCKVAQFTRLLYCYHTTCIISEEEPLFGFKVGEFSLENLTLSLSLLSDEDKGSHALLSITQIDWNIAITLRESGTEASLLDCPNCFLAIVVIVNALYHTCTLQLLPINPLVSCAW